MGLVYGVVRQDHQRALPYFEAHIKPLVLAGKSILVVAHGNSLRSLVMVLDDISEHGRASEVGELYRDTASIAAPITDRRRVTVGAIVITGPVDRLC